MQKLNSIQEMLTMQNALNEMTNGSEWRSGVTQLGKVIDWRRCIVMETAELIDSYPWKHWKSVDAQVDIENVRVELVDIWHFLLSLTLEKFDSEISADILDEALMLSLNAENSPMELTVVEQVQVHEQMMRIALEATTIDRNYLSCLAESFFDACKVADLDFDQLYQIYMAKNVLNKFRQDNGYKEGSYIKEWNGKEDNVVMLEIIGSMSEFSGDALYIGLQQAYSQIKVA